MLRRFETLTVQGCQNPKEEKSAISPAIYQTTAFEFENVDFAADLFDLKVSGDIYSRISNPTVNLLENRINLLEGGVGALSLSSGQSASLLSVLNITESNENIVASPYLYGGTFNLFSSTLKKFGIQTKFAQDESVDSYEKLIDDRTKCIFVESLTNPQLSVADIESLSRIAHVNGIALIVDNTIATPYLLKPFEYGADIVVHSTTKYISGHGNAMGGVIVDSGNFDWSVNSKKYKSLLEKDPSYHGISYVDRFGKSSYIVKARVQLLRDIGCCQSPFNAYLTLLGLETLHLRMKCHSENALKVAQYLQESDQVNWVRYPKLEKDPYYKLGEKYLSKGGSSIVSFELKSKTREMGTKFIENLKLPFHATNIGDVRTIVTYPALTTHRQLTKNDMEKVGISEGFIRLSVGLENVEDIIADIQNALEMITN